MKRKNRHQHLRVARPGETESLRASKVIGVQSDGRKTFQTLGSLKKIATAELVSSDTSHVQEVDMRSERPAGLIRC